MKKTLVAIFLMYFLFSGITVKASYDPDNSGLKYHELQSSFYTNSDQITDPLIMVVQIQTNYLQALARNVVEHGFTHDNRKHYLDVRIVKKEDEVILRIKDDCASFDPVSMSQQMNPEDKTKNIGLRMVMKLAKEANYQSLLGLNVMTIKM